jgi:hypothetical protein
VVELCAESLFVFGSKDDARGWERMLGRGGRSEEKEREE